MKHKPLNDSNTQQELNVSDEDIDRALNRLFEAVKNEEVPAAWLKQDERENVKPAQQPRETQPIQPEPQLHTLTFEQPSAKQDDALRRKAPRRLKKRWMSAASAAVLAGMLLFTSWGQDVMASMLNTFRVQKFETIEISQSDINSFRQALQDGAAGTQQLDLNKYGEIEQKGGGVVRTVTWEEALALSGDGQLKKLSGDGNAVVKYMPDQQITFKLNPKEINKMIAFLGGKTDFPASIEDSPIVLNLPGTFMTEITGQDGQREKQLVQLPAPSLDVSGDVDVDRIRQAVLDLPIIPEEMRTKLAGIGDWRHTLPIPSTSTDNIRTLKVDGHEAFITSSGYERSIIWLQNDWVYQLSGSEKAFPSEEAIIAEARGLMK
ncbi:hypothetical protein [Paenibacillus montanisoli]|uniref:DUF4367 domain-containing protein n=1 Tax=Paenibacillus montanisoli TaxID=2081970 RepID=A0A328TZ05_9BACL|nr:hypothetical protein [Paenibacillus montanisoli]RAP74992.1 hypothetical protein DL346_16475 [Paenibacillus montanisoli]